MTAARSSARAAKPAPAVRRPQPSRRSTTPLTVPKSRQLRVVKPTERLALARAKRARRLLAGGIAFAGLALLGVVAAHVTLAQNQMQLERLRSDVAVEQQDHEQLRLDVARLESPERIVAEATGRLGMTRPSDVQYVVPVAVTPNPAEAQIPESSRDASGTGTVDESIASYQELKPDLMEQR